jgi:hypothetical protein
VWISRLCPPKKSWDLVNHPCRISGNARALVNHAHPLPSVFPTSLPTFLPRFLTIYLPTFLPSCLLPPLFPSFVSSNVPPPSLFSTPSPRLLNLLFNGGKCLFQVKFSHVNSLQMPNKWHICQEGQADNNETTTPTLACDF